MSRTIGVVHSSGSMATSSSDIADSTVALTSGRARLWAILVGVNTYQDSQIPALQYSALDCCALADVLVTATSQFPKKQIVAHHDAGADPPTRAAVLASFAQVIQQAQPQDTVLFYFSGHGLIEPETKQAVLCLSDTQSNQLLETGLQMPDLLEQLDQCESRQQVVWLDACHSGELMLPGAKSAVVNTAAETTTVLVQLLRQQAVQNKGLYALLSCDQGQRSWEFSELGHGLFTHFLIQGLQGAAADQAGIISADGLYQYLYIQITQFINQKNQAVRRLNQQRQKEGLMHPEYPLQTPKRIVDGVGNLVIGMQRSSLGEPQTQSTLPSAEVSRFSTNRPRWHYLLWGWGAALGLGGLYLGGQFLLRPAAPGDPSVTCNLRIEPTEPLPKQIIEPQMLRRCRDKLPWQPAKVRALTEGNPVWGVAFGTDDALLVSGGGKGGEIWDLTRDQQTHILAGHTDSVYEIAVSPDAKRVVTASADRTARVWNVTKGTLEHILKGHQAAVWSVKISPDGETIATGGGDGIVKVWNAATGTFRNSFIGHQGMVFAVAFHPDNNVIASAGEDKTIKLWNRDGTALRELIGHQDAVRAIAFSPDGTKLASASWDQTVKIWDSQTGQLLSTLTGHQDRAVALAFSPDGNTLASGSIDKTIKLWSITDSRLLGTLYGHADWVLSLAFSPDGKILASGSRDQTILLWQK